MATEAFYGRRVQQDHGYETPSRTQPSYTYWTEDTAPSPETPSYHNTLFNQSPYHQRPDAVDRHLSTDSGTFDRRSTRQYSDDIPLTQHSRPSVSEIESAQKPRGYVGESGLPEEPRPRKRRPREPEKKGFFSGKTPWVVYAFTIIQVAVFLAELVKNGTTLVGTACANMMQRC